MILILVNIITSPWLKKYLKFGGLKYSRLCDFDVINEHSVSNTLRLKSDFPKLFLLKLIIN